MPDNLTCVADCDPIGFYKDTETYSHTGICSPCDPSCLTCTGPAATDCPECQPGYFQDSATGCTMCDNNCDHCFGPSNEECHNCTANFWKYGDHTCVDEQNCPERYYA